EQHRPPAARRHLSRTGLSPGRALRPGAGAAAVRRRARTGTPGPAHRRTGPARPRPGPALSSEAAVAAGTVAEAARAGAGLATLHHRQAAAELGAQRLVQRQVPLAVGAGPVG